MSGKGASSNAETGKDEQPKHPVLVKFEEIVAQPQSEWCKSINAFNTEYKWEGEKLNLKQWTNVFEKLKEPFTQLNTSRKNQIESKQNKNSTNSTLILSDNDNENLNLIVILLNCFVKLLSHSHRPNISAFNVLDVSYFYCIF